jgi:IS30 family transposase
LSGKLKHFSADEVVQHLIDVMSRWTRPHSVRCDNAKSFASALLRKLCETAKVQQHFVAPFAHQSNGQVENLNRRLEHVLRVMILDAKLGQRCLVILHFKINTKPQLCRSNALNHNDWEGKWRIGALFDNPLCQESFNLLFHLS